MNTIEKLEQPTFLKLTGTPPRTQRFQSVLLFDHHIYYYNGRKTNSIFYKLNLYTYEWETIRPLNFGPIIDNSAVGVVYNNLFYFCGGENDGILSIFYSFNPTTLKWKKLKDMPKKKEGHSAVVCGDKMIIFGGVEHRAYNEIEEYNFSTNQWRIVDAKGIKPAPRYDHGACTDGIHMYIFGGFARDYKFSDLFEYNAIDERWKFLSCDISNFGNISLLYYDHHLIRICGIDIDAFDLNYQKWKKIGSIPPLKSCCKVDCKAIIHQNNLYVLGFGAVFEDEMCKWRFPHNPRILLNVHFHDVVFVSKNCS